jgi:BASS family bile acid:Na+ symporter
VEGSFLTNVLIPVILAVMMIGLGLSLTLEDFRRILVYPKAVMLGTMLQIIFLPLAGFAVAATFPLTPEMAVGIMLLAACPGGVTSNVISHLARGDTALSVTLTVVSSFITVLTIPLVVAFALNHFMGSQTETALQVTETVIGIFTLTIPTVCLGMFIRAKAPSFADKCERPVRVLGGLFLALLVAGIAVKEHALIARVIGDVGVACLALCTFAGFMGYAAARLFGLAIRQRLTLCVEVGFQNTTLGLVIATSFLNNTEIAISPAFYAVVMFSLAAVLVALMNSRVGVRMLERV